MSAARAILLCVVLLPVPGSIVFALRDHSAPALAITHERPALIFNEYLIHYGPDAIDSKPVEEATFVFRNAGKSPVELGKLTPSCGCLNPRISQKTIAPGQIGRVTMPIRTVNEAPGFHEYLLTMEYVDPKPREVTLSVKIVLPEKQVMIEPRALWVMGASSRSIEHVVTVSDYRSTPLIIERATSSTDLFVPTIRERRNDGSGSITQVGITVQSDLPEGIHRGIIALTTSDPGNRILHVPVVARGKDRPESETIVVNPELVAITASTDATKSTNLEIAFPATWNLSHVDAFPLELNTAFEDVSTEGSDLKRLKFTVGFSILPPSPVNDGVITLYADEGRHRISVPVQIYWPQ